MTYSNYGNCINYAATHVVMCMVQYVNISGLTFNSGLFDEMYPTFVTSAASGLALNAYNLSIHTYEGSTNIMTITQPYKLNITYTYMINGSVTTVFTPSLLYPTAICLCTTDNCDASLDSCANGLNYSSSLLAVSATTTAGATTTVSRVTNSSTNQTTNTTMLPVSSTYITP